MLILRSSSLAFLCSLMQLLEKWIATGSLLLRAVCRTAAKRDMQWTQCCNNLYLLYKLYVKRYYHTVSQHASILDPTYHLGRLGKRINKHMFIFTISQEEIANTMMPVHASCSARESFAHILMLLLQLIECSMLVCIYTSSVAV